MHKYIILLFLISLMSQCTSESTKDSAHFEEDSITSIRLDNNIEKDTVKIERKWFASTLDTTITDTISDINNRVLVESISDSMYNEYYNENYKETKIIEIPYNYINKQWDKIERDILNKTNESVYRLNDTLIISGDSTQIALVNCNEGCEVGYSYYYVQYIEQMDFHAVYMASEGGGLFLYSAKTGKYLFSARDRIFCNSSLTQMISCRVERNELDGGWFNYFKWVYTSEEFPFSKLFSFDPNPYDIDKQISGFRDPIWISDKSLICKYVVLNSISSYEVDEKYCFVKLNIE